MENSLDKFEIERSPCANMAPKTALKSRKPTVNVYCEYYNQPSCTPLHEHVQKYIKSSSDDCSDTDITIIRKDMRNGGVIASPCDYQADHYTDWPSQSILNTRKRQEHLRTLLLIQLSSSEHHKFLHSHQELGKEFRIDYLKMTLGVL
uniref:Uncharacterized protein n=1 Tax=Glossina pallidipes TaxID=7398 RepID=A0A1A9ZZ77_GLOPL